MSAQDAACIDLSDIDALLGDFEDFSDDKLIPILQRVQDTYGYLPREVLLGISRRTGLPASRMFGVATFYEQFHLAPRGRHTVKCCRGTACHVQDGAEVRDTLTRLLQVEDGGTTEDMRFTLETVACLGTCFLAPVMMVDGDYYGELTPKMVEPILKRYD